MMSRLDQLTSSFTSKEKELTTLKNKNERLTEELERKTKLYEEQKEEFLRDKEAMLARSEELKNKLSEVSDKLMQRKLENGREIALLKQQNGFNEKKLAEMTKQQEEVVKKYEEKLQ